MISEQNDLWFLFSVGDEMKGRSKANYSEFSCRFHQDAVGIVDD